jgi:hypothetical protein
MKKIEKFDIKKFEATVNKTVKTMRLLSEAFKNLAEMDCCEGEAKTDKNEANGAI